MKMNMNMSEAEIDAIRLKLYEETKDLTREEQKKRLTDVTQRLATQYGFKTVASAKADRTSNVARTVPGQ
jgi:hypothetical protein